jgi:membrane protein required for colicin V production
MNPDIGWVDVAMLAILGLSMLIGAWRGLVFEVLSLAGWFVAYFAAQAYAPLLAPHLPVGAAGSALQHATAFACAFILALLVWSLAARLVRLLVRATPLKPVDRLFGAAFGIVRGVLALLILGTLIGYTPLAQSPPWQQSQGVGWLNTTVRELMPLLPQDWRLRT